MSNILFANIFTSASVQFSSIQFKVMEVQQRSSSYSSNKYMNMQVTSYNKTKQII